MCGLLHPALPPIVQPPHTEREHHHVPRAQHAIGEVAAALLLELGERLEQLARPVAEEGRALREAEVGAAKGRVPISNQSACGKRTAARA